MKASELRELIERNMANANALVEELRIQPNRFGDLNVAVVSSAFAPLPLSARRALALGEAAADSSLEWVDLLTTEERDLAGALPADIEDASLPLWPDALGRTGELDPPSIFSSEYSGTLEPPITATFYSLRGGVGRSTALAYTARILARSGKRVLCVDMDLEAPGLAALFGVEQLVSNETGIVALLLQLDRGGSPDITRHLVRLDESDELYLLPAGLPNAEYARRLNFIDPDAWYREERNPLRELVDALSTTLPFVPDYILFDARTGISPLSGPLLFDLSDLAVIVFFPHPQARIGTRELTRALLHARTRRVVPGDVLSPDVRFLVSPLPTARAGDVSQLYENRSLEWIAEWLEPVNGGRDPADRVVESDVAHFVAYADALATADSIVDDSRVWQDYQPIADWLLQLPPSDTQPAAPLALSDSKRAILGEVSVSSGTAESQDNIVDTFVETGAVIRALDPNIQLILGRKGTGKTAIFRKLSEDKSRPAHVILAPAALRPRYPWLLGPEGFKAAEEIMARVQGDWSRFWAIYTCLAISRDRPIEGAGSELAALLGRPSNSEDDTITLVERAASVPRVGLAANELLNQLDGRSREGTFVLIDGLDTGFGSSPSDRDRREAAISGLFSFSTNQWPLLRNLRLKVLLREDIWRTIRFENKSHLFGRSAALQWDDRIAYFKVVLKQVLASSATFRRIIDTSGRPLSDIKLELWSELDVMFAWNVLVGERMKGAKTTFTRNWVWNRLADGNQDHNPRSLLQLFTIVIERERQEQQRTPYDRSIIRPGALSGSLPDVSRQALDALKEEFQELEELLTRLETIARTPVTAQELVSLEGLISLAREVGLLAVYEETGERVDRYKVPELYRHALGMGRRGQV